MIRNLFRACGLFAFGFIVAVCGQSRRNEANDINEYGQYLQSIAVAQGNLPACVTENETQLAYVENEGFKVCRSGIWNEITISGPSGQQGDSPIDDDIQISANNVILSNGSTLSLLEAGSPGSSIGRLKSQNLRQALEDEIAVDVKELLVSKSWLVTSQYYAHLWDIGASVSRIYPRESLNSVRLTFNRDDSFSISSGCAPIIALIVCDNVRELNGTNGWNMESGDFKVIGSNAIRFTASVKLFSGATVPVAGLTTVASATKEEVLLVNYNGDGVGTEVALLTPAQ